MHSTRCFLGVALLLAAGCDDTTPTTGTDAGADVVTTDVVATDVVATDVVATGDVPADPWACLGMVPAPTATPGMGTGMFQAVNFQTNVGLAGLAVKACLRSDVMCATPASTGTTDAMGRVTLTYPLTATGFDGYIEFTGGTGAGAVVPTRSFLILTRSVPMGSFALVTQATFTALGTALGAMLDATHGGITFAATDCAGANARGVAVTTTPALTMGFYFVGPLPDTMATQTDGSGRGGFLNVAPGDYTVLGTRVTPMARIGSRTVNVRGGFLSSFNVSPTS